MSDASVSSDYRTINEKRSNEHLILLSQFMFCWQCINNKTDICDSKFKY